MPKKNTRKKRFLVDIKEKIPAYYSEPEEILTIAYEYRDEKIYVNKDYLEQIQIAVAQFNNFGFARLVYSPTYNEISFNPNCPIDETSLRKKYVNKHIFDVLPDFLSYISGSVYFNSPVESYISHIRYYLNSTPTSLPAFSVIAVAEKSPTFQLSATGILLHEIFHLFGIQDLIRLNINCTNGIYYPNLVKIDTENIRYINLRNINSFKCQTITYQNFNFTPFSLFSLQQYKRKAIHPFFILNETRIVEILTAYQFSAELQKDYFALLDAYQGRAHLITYQDFSALAQAIYLISPDSMLGRTFNVPDYYFIKGMYRPPADEEKFSHLISAFKKAENFNYPILAQDDLNVTVFNDTTFKIDLAKKLKVVSLTPAPIHCYLEKPKQFKGSLQVSNDCILTGDSQTVGNFTLDIVLSNNVTKTKLNRVVKLNIKEKNKPLTAILLGRRSVTDISEDSNVDLAALCHAVSLPDRDDLKCNSFDLPDNVSLVNCSILGVNREENYNFTVTFFNAAAEKSCRVQLLSVNTSTLVDNLIEQNSGVFIDKSLGLNNEDNTGYYVRYAHYVYEDYILSINGAANTVRFIVANGNYLKQCNYLLIIPLLHGVFEGCIDNIALSPLVKTILKLVPRIGLVSINYLSTLQFPFLFFYSVLESFVAGHLKAKNNDRFRHVVNLFLLLLVAELEYGFSNLWELADKPQFWPALTDRLNQLFIQMLWAPTIKTAGYLLGVSIMGCCAKAIPEENNETKVATNTAEGVLGCQLSFFNSLKSVKDTVFSSKIRRIPRLFYNCFFPLFQREGDDCSNRSEYLQNPVNQVQ